jgi:hypothetical protein
MKTNVATDAATPIPPLSAIVSDIYRSIDNMPKQSKSKTIAVETERRRAEIIHNRRVKEILEENERKRTPFDRWSRQRYHLSMDLPSTGVQKSYVNQRLRSGLIVNNAQGYPRFALRRRAGDVETDDNTAKNLIMGNLVYVPEGLGGLAGNPPIKYEGDGSGKPKHKKKAKAAKRS